MNFLPPCSTAPVDKFSFGSYINIIIPYDVTVTYHCCCNSYKDESTNTPADAVVAYAETIESILSDEDFFELSDSPTVTRKMIPGLAQYARTL